MQLSVIQWVLVYGTAALQAAVLLAMVRRKLRLSFPYFFSFAVFNLVTQLLQAVLVPHLGPFQYFYLFWTIQAISTQLIFLVMYEIFLHVLRPYSALLDFGKLLFRWALLFLALASVLTAIATNGVQAAKICAAIQLLNRSAELMQCGLLLLLILFEKRLGLPWQNPAVCIMLGAGTVAAVDLIGSYARISIPTSWHAWDLANSVTWLLVNGAWGASFALARREQPIQYQPTRLILQRWNEALMTTPLVSRKHQIAMSPIESFLPGVEQTVERVMARKMMH